MSDQGSVYNCKNHPGMRWWDTKPNGKLVFEGEIRDDGLLYEAAFEPGNPMIRLKQYANNQNPYAPTMQLDPPITWKRIVDYMKYVEYAWSRGETFECDCSARDLVKLPDETYNTLQALPRYAVKAPVYAMFVKPCNTGEWRFEGFTDLLSKANNVRDIAEQENGKGSFFKVTLPGEN